MLRICGNRSVLLQCGFVDKGLEEKLFRKPAFHFWAAND